MPSVLDLVVPPGPAAQAGEAMAPEPARVIGVVDETADTVTLELEPPGGEVWFRPGQFEMVYAFGVGECALSITGHPDEPGRLVHTVRRVGAVTRALAAAAPGDVIGVRGPFGTSWPVREATGGDVLVIAGGIGLAPLRPVVLDVLDHRDDFESVAVIYGARQPADLLYRVQIQEWRSRFDADVEVTVDTPDRHWRGSVGVVTDLLPRVAFTPGRTTAFVCGPEVMMRFAARDLLELGVAEDRIFVSMERNMKCAVGFCGHCQFGPAFLCRDGPVVPYSFVRRLWEVWEL